MEYLTVKEENSDQFVEKKSRFIGTCRPVKTEEEALDFIARMKSKYWTPATTCTPTSSGRTGCSASPTTGSPRAPRHPGDGHPEKGRGGRRGRGGHPVLRGHPAGGRGLIRAYSHTATIALAAAQKVAMRECLLLELPCDYGFYGKAAGLIPECGGVVDDTQFLEQVTLRFHLEPSSCPPWRKSWRIPAAAGHRSNRRASGSSPSRWTERYFFPRERVFLAKKAYIPIERALAH